MNSLRTSYNLYTQCSFDEAKNHNDRQVVYTGIQHHGYADNAEGFGFTVHTAVRVHLFESMNIHSLYITHLPTT